MKHLYRDHAVVLRTWRLGESDRIVSLSTRNNGQVRAVAKGVRKTRSRFGARVEPTTHGAIQLYRGRELDVVTQFEVIDPFSGIRGDLDRLGRAAMLLESIDRVGLEREPNAAHYHLLVGALRALERQDKPLLVAGFLLKLLAQEGVGPNYEQCMGCGNADDLAFFDAAGGGMRCRSCGGGLLLPAGALDVLVAISQDRLRQVIDLPVSPVTQSVERAAMLAFERHVERHLRSPHVHAESTAQHTG